MRNATLLFPRFEQSAGTKVVAVTLSASLMVFGLPMPRVEAAHLGSSSASAGNPFLPTQHAVEAFQPDLFTGRAVSSVPLLAPPGRKVEPALALSYASSQRNSWVGVGWALDLGAIERSTKHGVPTYDATDTFMASVHGVQSELVKIPDGTYRAKHEGAFLHFAFDGAQWVVRDKSGTTYFFGRSAASRMAGSGGTFRWALDRVVDTNGNFLEIDYVTETGMLYPVEIRYTGHEPTSELPEHHVTFTLEDRPDHDRSFRSGAEHTIAKRLKAVAMYTSAQLARKYVLGYTLSPRTQRSLLTSVTLVGTDGISTLPPQTFTYQADVLAYDPPRSSLLPTLTGDVNGDGITDAIHYDTSVSPASWRVALGLTTGFGPSSVWYTGGTSAETPLVGDWDSDGMTDVALFKASSGDWDFMLSTGTSFYGTGKDADFGANEAPLTGDFNGDGWTDLATFEDSAQRYTVALNAANDANSAAAFLAPGTWLTGAGANEPMVGDFNGDGLTDVGAVDQPGQKLYVSLSNGSVFLAPVLWSSGVAFTTTFTTGDFNSDGLTDFAYYESPRVWCLWSSGSAFATRDSLDSRFTLPTTSRLQAGDGDGDGLLDPCVYESSTSRVEWAFSAMRVHDLLATLDNGLRGTTTVTYTPSTAFDNTGEEDALPDLPFVTPVVTRTDTVDGLGHTLTTTYTYEGGRYDAGIKEFVGFRTVQVKDALLNVAEHRFLQSEWKQGKLESQELRDSSGNRWTRQEHIWSRTEVYPGVQFIFLNYTDAFRYDGDATFKQTRTEFAYDAYGNVRKVTERGELAVSGDERVTNTEFTYNVPAWILGTPSHTWVSNLLGTEKYSQRTLFYDGNPLSTDPPLKGNLTREDAWLNPGVDPATVMTYDAYGNVLTITDAEAHTTTNTYDPVLHTYLTEIKNALSYTRTLTYDPRFGTVLTSTDPNAQTTTTRYDVFGRVVKVIGPTDTDALPTVAYTYDLDVFPIRTVTQLRVQSGQPEVITTYAFADGLGRMLQTRTPAEDPAQQVVSGDQEYDTRGLVSAAYLSYAAANSTIYVAPDPAIAKVRYEYDAVQRLVKAISPDTTFSETRYDDWRVTAIDANGHQTRRTSDAYGRLATVEEFKDAEIYTTTYAYDALDNLTQTRDHAGNLVTMTYDQLSRKLTMSDPDMGAWIYTYDKVDNLKTQKDARLITTTFTYDAVNRVTRKDYSDTTADVTYTYDDPVVAFSKGRLTKVSYGVDRMSFIYDALGRVVSETKKIDGQFFTVARSYDLLGRVTTLKYPDGEVVTTTYNNQGAVERVASSAQVYVSNLDYNAAGQATKIVYGNGVVSDYTYNPLTLRLDRLVSQGASGVLQDFTYTFDNIGNVKTITDAVHTGTQAFLYDDLDRLIQATGSYGVRTYAYDAIGNLTLKDGVTQVYADVRPHAISSTSDGKTFTYDANGNRKTLVDAIGTTTYTHDTENRLTQVTAPTGTTKFAYDGDGGRVKQISPASVITRYVGELAEKTGSRTTKYVFAGSVRVAAKESTGMLRFYHSDHLGSSNVITDGAGLVVELAEYTPYGSLNRREGPANVPHKFTGQRLDASTGLYFYQARYYDTSVGRFLTADPFVQAPADPQTLNRYSYCRNNPINFVDPSGYGWFSKLIAAIVAIVVAIVVTVVTENPGLGIGTGVLTYHAVNDALSGSAEASASEGTGGGGGSPTPPTSQTSQGGAGPPGLGSDRPPRRSVPQFPGQDLLRHAARGAAAGLLWHLGERLYEATQENARETARAMAQAADDLSVLQEGAGRGVSYAVNRSFVQPARWAGHIMAHNAAAAAPAMYGHAHQFATNPAYQHASLEYTAQYATIFATAAGASGFTHAALVFGGTAILAKGADIALFSSNPIGDTFKQAAKTYFGSQVPKPYNLLTDQAIEQVNPFRQ